MKTRFLTLAAMLTVAACTSDDVGDASLSFRFRHKINDEPVVFNEMRYTNAAENLYEVTELQYFISNLTLVAKGGGETIISAQNPCHYIDTNIPATMQWTPPGTIPAGEYTMVKFTFGLDAETNKPGRFPDLPESNMIWPHHMGGNNGAYHYMKFNGFWRNAQQQRTPFNAHIGVGREMNDQNEPVAFIQNFFTVEIPVSIMISPGGSHNIDIIMDAASWFASPHVYDHNQYGGMIMMNQEAMRKLCDNGKDAFSAVSTLTR